VEVWTLAQVTSTDPLVALLQYGVIGIVLVAVFAGQLWVKPSVVKMEQSYDREISGLKEDNSRLRQERAQLQKLLMQEASAISTQLQRLTELQQEDHDVLEAISIKVSQL
jgi:hypothetical protein